MGNRDMLRNKRLIIASLVIAALWAGTANAVTAIGLGIESCGSWTEARRTRASFGHQQWVVGFISGVAGALSNDLFEGKDAEGVWGWLDNYCRAHPLEILAVATAELINTIQPKTFTPLSRTGR
jgi:hypothetical protein